MTEFKQEVYDATMFKLSNNLIGMNTMMDMLDKKQVTKDICINVLSYLMFLKRIRTSVVKGRGCTDGRQQRAYISKEESSSPTHTITTCVLFVSCAMDTIEGYNVVTCDSPRVFLKPTDQRIMIIILSLKVSRWKWFTKLVQAIRNIS